MNSPVENEINKFISDRSINSRTIISQAFNMNCEKILLTNGEAFVMKYYRKNDYRFNALISEINSLKYLKNKFPKLFPSIRYKSSKLLIVDYIQHDNIKKKNYQIILAKEILKLHKLSNNKYGFKFDAQIGGMRQANNYENNWVDFFKNKRLNMIFETINKSKPMPKIINDKVEKLMRDIENFIPRYPKSSLLHGDLWEGNILFDNGRLLSFIDPGIYFGHNELEIAYLTWFKFVDESFLNYYSNYIKIDKYYLLYEPIYQLFFSLLNVHLWDREIYIKDTNKLLQKIFKHKD